MCVSCDIDIIQALAAPCQTGWEKVGARGLFEEKFSLHLTVLSTCVSFWKVQRVLAQGKFGFHLLALGKESHLTKPQTANVVARNFVTSIGEMKLYETLTIPAKTIEQTIICVDESELLAALNTAPVVHSVKVHRGAPASNQPARYVLTLISYPAMFAG